VLRWRGVPAQQRMINSTTTCAFSAPLDSAGATPMVIATPWNYSQEICTTESSSTISDTGGFTYGELTVAFFLFLILAVISYSFFYQWVKGFRIRV